MLAACNLIMYLPSASKVWIKRIGSCLILSAAMAATLSCQKNITSKKPVGWGALMTNPSLNEHQKKWQQWHTQNLRHYRYKFRMQCDCNLATINSNHTTSSVPGEKWLIIEVLDKKIISVKNIDNTNNSLYAEFAEGKDLIEKGFERMEYSIKHEYADNYALYDDEYSFPRYLSTTGRKGPTDIEYKFEIVEFEILDGSS